MSEAPLPTEKQTPGDGSPQEQQNMKAYCAACACSFVTSWVSLRTRAARCPICGGKLTASKVDGAA